MSCFVDLQLCSTKFVVDSQDSSKRPPETQDPENAFEKNLILQVICGSFQDLGCLDLGKERSLLFAFSERFSLDLVGRESSGFISCACCIGFDYLLGVLVLLFQSAAVFDLAEVASDPWKALNFAN